MEQTLKYLEYVEDRRQEHKVLHKMSDIIAIVFFAMLANADDWVEIEVFAKTHEKFLRKYLTLKNGIPSHDTIQRVFEMVAAEFLQEFQKLWNKILLTDEGEKVKKLLAIDGKTQRGTNTKAQKANHIVSAVDEEGFCLGQSLVSDKSNEITAIPELLSKLNIKGHIITTDAMGCQKEIVKIIKQKRADYVLALKGNHETLYDDVSLYFSDAELLKLCAYTKTLEKAHGCIEKREYWQTEDISWLHNKKEWSGLKSIAMTKNTIRKDGKITEETRYFISSLPLCIDDIARSIRGHWMVESYHWHLDVTFREDVNRTLDKHAAFNLNIVRKIAINILRLLDVGQKKVSLKIKRYMFSLNVEKYLEQIMTI